MLDLIYALGREQFFKIAAATVGLPQKPKLFGTMKPAANLTPTKSAFNKIKPLGGSTGSNLQAVKPLQSVGSSTAQANKT